MLALGRINGKALARAALLALVPGAAAIACLWRDALNAAQLTARLDRGEDIVVLTHRAAKPLA